MNGREILSLARKKFRLRKLKERLGSVVRKHGSLTHPEALAISRKMDKLVVEIMTAEIERGANYGSNREDQSRNGAAQR